MRTKTVAAVCVLFSMDIIPQDAKKLKGNKNFFREVGPVSVAAWIAIGILAFNALFVIFLRLIIWMEDRRDRK